MSLYDDDKLNMFIDSQLDLDEMNRLHEELLDNVELRERVCQLKAVRELVRYAYENPPRSAYEERDNTRKPGFFWKAVAASLMLAIGAILGWQSNEYAKAQAEFDGVATADTAFKFFAAQAASDIRERKIVLHISTDDIGVINAALNEVDTLLASYKTMNTPLKIDIVTNKTGINLLRVGTSPYLDRIENMVSGNDVSLYACKLSIVKAEKRESAKIVLLPDTIIDKSARELIPDRLNKGWVYIKV